MSRTIEDTLHPYSFPRVPEKTGLLHIGSVNMDVTINDLNQTSDGSNPRFKLNEDGSIDLTVGDSFMVLDKSGKVLLHAVGPYKTAKEAPDWRLLKGTKYSQINENIVKRVLRYFSDPANPPRLGGGLANFTRAWTTQFSIPIATYTLRAPGEMVLPPLKNVNDLSQIVRKAHMKTNLVVERLSQEALNKVIIRGKSPVYQAKLRVNDNHMFTLRGLVLNSLDDPDMVKLGLSIFDANYAKHRHFPGFVCLTDKMSHSYEQIAELGIRHNMIPILNGVELIQYAHRTTASKKALKVANEKGEDKLTYKNIVDAIGVVRKEQAHPTRIFVTLGPYGSIGVGAEGTVYRVLPFDVPVKQTNGAGDVYASTLVQRQGLMSWSSENEMDTHHIMAYASAAAALHVAGETVTPQGIAQMCMGYKDQRLPFEVLGKFHNGNFVPARKSNGNYFSLNQDLKNTGHDPVTEFRYIKFK